MQDEVRVVKVQLMLEGLGQDFDHEVRGKGLSAPQEVANQILRPAACLNYQVE
jgi:hypothetical protein